MDSELDAKSKEDLSSFLNKVDKIEELVKGLVTSDDTCSTSEALKKADNYIDQYVGSGGKKEEVIVYDRTLINTTTQPSDHTPSNKKGVSQGEEEQVTFLKSLEEDAKERGERRKERELRGREFKKKGNKSFREGSFEEALEHFTAAIKETPWDIALYTNRALTYNKMLKYSDAIKDCDLALRFEPATLKAYIHKGNALKGQECYDKAMECFSEAHQLFPEQKKQIDVYLNELRNAPH